MSDPESPSSDIEDGGLIRSEERLDVTTHRVPVARAVLRKVIVVEQRTITVDVAHEEVRLERIELDPDDGEPTEQPHGVHAALPDLVLHTEEIVVTKRLVPTERVRLEISTEEEERRITQDLRRERVELTGEADPAEDGAGA